MSIEGCLGGNYFSHPKRLFSEKKRLNLDVHDRSKLV